MSSRGRGSRAAVKTVCATVANARTADVVLTVSTFIRFLKEATQLATYRITAGATPLKATQPAQALNLRFPGQYADSETGEFYNYFRQYDSRTGRYTQGDPIGLEGGLNRFGYVDGNPLNFTDPMGLQTTVDAAIRNALGKGEIAELETLLEAANPEQAALIRSGIEKYGSRATDYIAKNCKGSINREFPGQFKDKTLKEILDQSKSGDSAAKKRGSY